MPPSPSENPAKTPNLPEIQVPTTWTLLGLAGGLLLGWLLRNHSYAADINRVLKPIGSLWLHGLQMTILPLVVSLLVLGVAQTIHTAKGGALARRSLGLFAGLLFLGALIAAFLTPLFLRLIPLSDTARQSFQTLGQQSATAVIPEVSAFFTALIPANVITAASNDAILPTLLFFALFAAAIGRLPQRQNQHLLTFFEAIASAMMIVVGWVLALAPLGVFALSFGVTAQSGSAAILVLTQYIAVVSLIGGVVLILAYIIAILFGKRPFGDFFKCMLPVHAVALATQSSLASLPAMLIACRKLGIKDSSAEFTLPLAVALFRATGPAMNLAVAIYVAYLSGVTLTPLSITAGVAVACITTMGAPSLPGAISFVSSVGPIALAMGVPIAPLAILLSVEMLPDLMRTIGNVAMDVAVTSVVDRQNQSNF